jgi:hypothetical protein
MRHGTQWDGTPSCTRLPKAVRFLLFMLCQGIMFSSLHPFGVVLFIYMFYLGLPARACPCCCLQFCWPPVSPVGCAAGTFAVMSKFLYSRGLCLVSCSC